MVCVWIQSTPDLCAAEAPPLHINGDHSVECHYPGKTLVQHRAEQEQLSKQIPVKEDVA